MSNYVTFFLKICDVMFGCAQKYEILVLTWALRIDLLRHFMLDISYFTAEATLETT